MAQQIVDTYEVNNSNDTVRLSLAVGYGHRSVSSVELNGNDIIVSPPGDAQGKYVDDFSIPIDANANLSGKTLSIDTLVQQFSPDPRTSVTIVLTGGLQTKTWTENETNQTVNYGFEITFK
jgi:hypothetical protein